MRGPIELAPGVHALGSEMINWFAVAEGGRLTVVDAGVSGFARRLEADLARIGRAPRDVEAVVLTHSDADHTGVARALQAAGARVMIHPADAPTLRRPGFKGGDASPRHLIAEIWRPGYLRIFAHGIRHGARPLPLTADETFSDGERLDVPGRPRVVHTPGHTPGHCALLFEHAGALFVGDALCTHELFARGGEPRMMPSFFNEDNRAALASLAAIERLDAAFLLPGHGNPWRGGPAAAVAAARAQAGAG